MEGIVVEISDHPTVGNSNGNYKRKVLIDGLTVKWSAETIDITTICTYYENNLGAYGEPVSVPVPIVINRPLVARTAGGKVVFVNSLTGSPVIRKIRQVEEPIPLEEQVEGGPTTRMVDEEYWVLESDDVTEIPLVNVQTLFAYLENILRNQPTIVGTMMTQFVQAEVAYGTYDRVGL